MKRPCVLSFVVLFVLAVVFWQKRNLAVAHNSRSPYQHRELGLSRFFSLASAHTDTRTCLHNYEFLENQFKVGKVQRNISTTSLSLLASYSYSNYSVVTLQSDGWYGKEVYCRYLSSSFEEISVPVKSKVYPEWVVHCCRVDGAAYMSITVHKSARLVEWVPIVDRYSRGPVYELSLCVAPLYGNESKWLLLAETIEHYKLQGVDHFLLYIKDIDEYSRRLVESYVRSGEAEVIHLNYLQDRPGLNWQLVGVQDCLHRTRRYSKRAIFADIDERIVPNDISLRDFVKNNFDEDSSIGSLRFPPRWILRDKTVPEKYEGYQTLVDHLPTKVFHNTSAFPPAGHTTKCIIDPEKVMTMWVHSAWQFFSGYLEQAVAPEEASVRHYRDVVSGSWGKLWLPEVESFGEFKNTSYPSELLERLMNNVHKRLHFVYPKE